MKEQLSGYKFDGFIEIKPGIYYCEKDGTPWSNRKFGPFTKYLNHLNPCKPSKKGYYYIRYNYNTHPWHRFIWEHLNGPIPENMDVDHLDNNPLNNRIENLQLLEHKNNNRKCLKQKHNTSGYPGVYWNKNDKKWMCQITINGKGLYLGSFKDPQEAFVCYLENKIHYHGWESILPIV